MWTQVFQIKPPLWHDENDEYIKVSRFGISLQDFDGAIFGAEYLTLKRGEMCVKMHAEQGWAYGIRVRDRSTGWYPAEFWTQMLQKPAEFSRLQLNENAYRKSL